MRILFQGDSVTDCGRNRAKSADTGAGYVSRIAHALPDPGMEILNRGVAGDRVSDLEARWQADCLDLRPDVVSILIGINNVWRHFDSGEEHDLEVFEIDYQRLIDRIAPTARRVILMEPFLIPSAPDKEPMRPLVDATIQVIRTLARRNHLDLVPLDGLFTAACRHHPTRHWAEDGVHPSAAGHQLIADAWLDAYRPAASPAPPAKP